MRVLGRDALEHADLDVGPVVAVSVLEPKDLRRRRDQQAAAPEFQAGHAVQALGKHDQAVGFAVAVVVRQDHDLVLQRLLGVPVRIGRPGGGPEPAIGVDGHLHRLDQVGKLLFGGEQIHFHALGHLHLGHRRFAPQEREFAVLQRARDVGFHRYSGGVL